MAQASIRELVFIQDNKKTHLIPRDECVQLVVPPYFELHLQANAQKSAAVLAKCKLLKASCNEDESALST
ncbi:hypothetical protein DVH26_31125 [Paenibacillus sp. H1-7]|nr:hypothetical protein DVH26_31125 [Paenibacillus sp. H1-7]